MYGGVTDNILTASYFYLRRSRAGIVIVSFFSGECSPNVLRMFKKKPKTATLTSENVFIWSTGHEIIYGKVTIGLRGHLEAEIASKKFAWKNLDGFSIFCQRVLVSEKASNNSNPKELSLLSPNPKYSLPPNSPAAGILVPDLVSVYILLQQCPRRR